MSASIAFEVLPSHARLVRLPEVQRRTGKSRTAIYIAMKRGDFPQNIDIGERAVAWLESDIDRWISERIARTRGCADRIADSTIALGQR